MKYDLLVENEIDNIDAAVFTGDLFLNKLNREDFRCWLDRWDKQLLEYDAIDSGIEFKIGDAVKVVAKIDIKGVMWTTYMDRYIGKEFVISNIDYIDSSVEFEGVEWWFPVASLEVIKIKEH